MLTASQIARFRRTGHLTVDHVFDESTIRQALLDIQAWSQSFLECMPENQRHWYVERRGKDDTLRKLDHPVFHRPVFRSMASDDRLVGMVEQLIGRSVSVFFSQLFLKPAGVGGPKPIHQDNHYFDPSDADALLTAWVALDDANTSNGCLYYCDEHQAAVLPHFAPIDEPFNLQIPADVSEALVMEPAPVCRGGVSFHHGNTPHQSSENRSQKPRRAMAIHYLRTDAHLVAPALDYDPTMDIRIS